MEMKVLLVNIMAAVTALAGLLLFPAVHAQIAGLLATSIVSYVDTCRLLMRAAGSPSVTER